MPISAEAFATLALALEGVEERPHFDRRAFRVARNFATLAADGRTANLKLLPDEQAIRCETMPDVFSPVPGKWGEQGWTTLVLEAADSDVAQAALRMAWRHALPGSRPEKRSR
ncbi:MAG: MmcQ/YjbR family DNA-binding protein [Flavobacteriaceae bacterium]